MKNLILVFTLLLFFVTSSFSQVWLEVGGKVMYGINGFYNKNLFDDGSHSFTLGSGLAYGGEVNVNFSDRHGINIEALLSKNVQDFVFVDGIDSYSNEVVWKNLDAYVLYRSYSPGGVYFELGPKISLVNSLEHNIGLQESNDWDKYYSKQYYSGSLGFGGFLAGSEMFSLRMGIRVDYAFGDLVNTEGKEAGYPVYYRQYDSYAASHPWSANVSLSFNFAIGGVAKARCGERVFILGNGY